MKRFAFLIVGVFLFALACNDAAKPPVAVNKPPVKSVTPAPHAASDGHDHAGEENVPRITVADAKKDFDSKSAVFIDTHAKQQFDAEHIPGAINVQANMIRQEADKIPKGKKIIAYCS